MGFFKKVGNALSHVVDFRVDRWFNVKGHQESVSYITTLARRLVRLPPYLSPTSEEQSFETLVAREKLTNEWLRQQAARYQIFARWFVGATLLLFLYTLLLVYLRSWTALCITVALMIYTLSAAFRFHFLYFQILQRQLTCTPKEWGQFMLKTAKETLKTLREKT